MQGILFKPHMLIAISEGRKTQTRRVMKPQPALGTHSLIKLGEEWLEEFMAPEGEMVRVGSIYQRYKPRYHIGEVVYIKEAFQYITLAERDEWKDKAIADNSFRRMPDGTAVTVWYKLDGYEIGADWLNPRTMPAWAARNFIKIMDVRPERLQSITDNDAIAEGVLFMGGIADNWDEAPWCASVADQEPMKYPRHAYARLWDSINPKFPWASNPWVWVYQFEIQNIARMKEQGR